MSFRMYRLARKRGNRRGCARAFAQTITLAERARSQRLKKIASVEMRLSPRNYDRLRAISNDLQGPQEIDDLLLLLSFQFIEAVDDHVGFAAFALVSLDGFNQIRRASIMEEEHALPHAPERSG